MSRTSAVESRPPPAGLRRLAVSRRWSRLRWPPAARRRRCRERSSAPRAIPATAAGAPTAQADFNRMRSARLGTLRINFDWARVEPTPGAPRDWSYYDTMVERAARARVGILAVLVGSPPFAADGSAYAPLTAGRAGLVQALRARRGAALRARRQLLELPPRRAAAADPRLPGLERAELPAALVRRAVGAREYASLLKLIGRTIRANDRRATDRHGRPARQLHARAPPATATSTTSTR